MGLIRSAVGLVLHPGRDCAGAMETITGWARARDVTVLGLEGEVGRITGDAATVGPGELAERADCSSASAATARCCGRCGWRDGRAPVLGVNLGRLGFLAEVDVPDLAEALSAIDEHRFTIEPRSAVMATFAGGDTVAFNDVALARIPGKGTTAAVELRVEEHPFVRYAADAVVVATPTGSTAYSFSAGGPIVSPTAEGLLVVPVAPHSAFNRALFLSGGEKLASRSCPPAKSSRSRPMAGSWDTSLSATSSSSPCCRRPRGWSGWVAPPSTSGHSVGSASLARPRSTEAGRRAPSGSSAKPVPPRSTGGAGHWAGVRADAGCDHGPVR